MYSCEPLNTAEQRQSDKFESTYSSSVLIRDVALRTSWKQWMIEKGGKRGSGISMLIARHDDDANCIINVKEPSPSYYLPLTEGRIVGFIPFPSILVPYALFRI